MAASLIWRGVAKCGSPAPKLTRFTPCARRRAASAVTAMVAETSMRPMRSEKVLVAAVLVAVMMFLFFQILEKCGGEFVLRRFNCDVGAAARSRTAGRGPQLSRRVRRLP